MSLDTKYRPTNFDEVLGQENTNAVLKQFIISGTGFHQSYLFAGPYGSGKTTEGRILARGLLCDEPVEGNPCNKCPSCVEILDHGSSENFVEFDAATNSGKADIKAIVAETEFSSFSGKRKIFLVDECFTEDTRLWVKEEGSVQAFSIREIVENRIDGKVLAFDIDSGTFVWDQIINWFDLGDREVVRLYFDNGVELAVTTNQKFFTKNRGWVKACDLTEDDEVVARSLSECLWRVS